MGDDEANAELFAELDAIVTMLERSWIDDVYPLRVSMAEFDRLAEALQRYPGSVLLQMWHVDYLLIGCRRLVDEADEAVSIRRALLRLRRVADELTPAVLASYRGHRSIEAVEVDSVAREIKAVLGSINERRNWQEAGST